MTYNCQYIFAGQAPGISKFSDEFANSKGNYILDMEKTP